MQWYLQWQSNTFRFSKTFHSYHKSTMQWYPSVTKSFLYTLQNLPFISKINNAMVSISDKVIHLHYPKTSIPFTNQNAMTSITDKVILLHSPKRSIHITNRQRNGIHQWQSHSFTLSKTFHSYQKSTMQWYRSVTVILLHFPKPSNPITNRQRNDTIHQWQSHSFTLSQTFHSNHKSKTQWHPSVTKSFFYTLTNITFISQFKNTKVSISDKVILLLSPKPSIPITNQQCNGILQWQSHYFKLSETIHSYHKPTMQ